VGFFFELDLLFKKGLEEEDLILKGEDGLKRRKRKRKRKKNLQ